MWYLINQATVSYWRTNHGPRLSLKHVHDIFKELPIRKNKTHKKEKQTVCGINHSFNYTEAASKTVRECGVSVSRNKHGY